MSKKANGSISRVYRSRLALSILLSLAATTSIFADEKKSDETEAKPKPAVALPPSATNVHFIPWVNNFSYLADPEKRTGATWEKFSYIPIGENPQNYLSIGGELRYYAQYWEHVTLGVRPNDKNDSVNQRVRLNADLHLGKNFRAFVEIGDNWEFNAEFPTPSNFDAVDIQQAFVDATFEVGDGNRLTFRPGRFIMPLGNGILMGTRDGTNVRYTYDGLRTMLTTKSGNRLDLFAVRPTRVMRGSFDDKPDNTRDMSGAYFSHPTAPGSGIDFYYYNVGHDSAAFPGLVGKQRRHSFGTRKFGRVGAWDYDVEGTLQTGKYVNDDIRAWALISNAGYTFADARFTPRIGARFNAFSGDDDPGEGKLGTFEVPFPRTALHTDSGLFTFMNLVNFAPSVSWQFTPKFRFQAGYDWLWRESTKDAIYYGGTGRVLANVPTDDRDVATSIDLQADWQFNRSLNFHAYMSRISAGDALKAAGGEDTNYYSLWAQYRF